MPTIETKSARYPLLTKPEAARLLRCSVRHLENEVNRKALAVVRLGGRCVRFRPQDVDRYVEARRLRAAGE